MPKVANSLLVLKVKNDVCLQKHEVETTVCSGLFWQEGGVGHFTIIINYMIKC